MKKSSFFFLVLLSCTLIYCEDNNRGSAEPPRDLVEQRTVDNDSLLEFLNTHYYNYEEFQAASSGEQIEFIIDTVGQSLRNANLQIRSEPPNPQLNVGPWNQSTIESDFLRPPLEIGCGSQ